ncbi:MAG: MFS transporter [Negativicutes bacterium]|nr:MFS transporter [Negativicutes bacterium]
MKTPTAWEILHIRDFRLFWGARVFNTLAYQMSSVAVGWQIYDLTGSAFTLGLVGLMQFLPMFALTLIAGHFADRYDRRKTVFLCQLTEGAGTLLLAAGSHYGWLTEKTILELVLLIGVARAFERPAMQAMMPGLVPVEHLARAVAWNTSSFQTATIVGPALGGLLYAVGPAEVYSIVGVLFVLASLFIVAIRRSHISVRKEPASLASVFAGIAFIRSRPAILGAISLDLFAVLLGGATALLPIYAKEILFVGPGGLGLLRSAPAVGALSMSLLLAYRPLRRRVGRTMFVAVIVFGLATTGFAVSASFPLSLSLLAVLGAADVISMVVRGSLVQIGTPDEMRGRVSAVNLLFVGTSNQLGEFESGLTAGWFGVVPSVLIGGVGTIIVALLWMRWFPDLTKFDTL